MRMPNALTPSPSAVHMNISWPILLAGSQLLDLLCKWAELEFTDADVAAAPEAEWLAAPLAAAQRGRMAKELPKDVCAAVTRCGGYEWM